MRIALAGIAKAYGATPVVKDLDLDIADGEFFTLLGASGSGKTTTLRMIAGLEAPDSGAVRIGDKTMSDAAGGLFLPPEQRNLGMVFQSYAVWPHLSVSANCALGLKAAGLSPDIVKARVAEALEMTGMARFAERMPHQLSGGQQQRVAIARAIAQQPSVLLFDEPLSNLDARLREQMRIEIRALATRLGITVVYVTHDQTEAMALSDRIGMMHGGRLVQCASPEEIYRQPATREVATFLGLANLMPAEIASDVARIGQAEIALGKATQPGPCTMMIRPEEIVFAEGSAGWAATVVNRVLLGALNDYEVEVPALGTRLRIQEISTAPLRSGTVRIDLSPYRLHRLPPAA